MADQLGPPAPAAGQVAGCPSALGQVAEEAEAVGQVAGAAGGQVAGGAGCWAGQGEEPLAAGDQGGKLCSMQVHRQTDREERKETEKEMGSSSVKKSDMKLEPQPNFPFLIHYQKCTSSNRDSTKSADKKYLVPPRPPFSPPASEGGELASLRWGVTRSGVTNLLMWFSVASICPYDI